MSWPMQFFGHLCRQTYEEPKKENKDSAIKICMTDFGYRGKCAKCERLHPSLTVAVIDDRGDSAYARVLVCGLFERRTSQGCLTQLDRMKIKSSPLFEGVTKHVCRLVTRTRVLTVVSQVQTVRLIRCISAMHGVHQKACSIVGSSSTNGMGLGDTIRDACINDKQIS